MLCTIRSIGSCIRRLRSHFSHRWLSVNFDLINTMHIKVFYFLSFLFGVINGSEGMVSCHIRLGVLSHHITLLFWNSTALMSGQEEKSYHVWMVLRVSVAPIKSYGDSNLDLVHPGPEFPPLNQPFIGSVFLSVNRCNALTAEGWPTVLALRRSKQRDRFGHPKNS